MESMFAIMKRIHELRTRFGLDAARRAPVAPGGRDGYHQHLVRAVGDARKTGQVPQGPAGITGATVEDIRKIADYHAARNNVPASLVKAVIEAESGFNPGAVSPKGARGLMQLMPATIRDFGVKNPFDPNENIGAGVSLLKTLLKDYNWDYKKALAAYNAGKTAVEKSGGVPPFGETREYIRKVIDAYVRNSE